MSRITIWQKLLINRLAADDKNILRWIFFKFFQCLFDTMAQKVFADPEWTDFVKQKAADPVYEEYTDDASIQKFYDNWKSVICWLQYDNGVAEKSPEDFGIARVAE